MRDIEIIDETMSIAMDMVASSDNLRMAVFHQGMCLRNMTSRIGRFQCPYYCDDICP
jgi:hypothetical protein